MQFCQRGCKCLVITQTFQDARAFGIDVITQIGSVYTWIGSHFLLIQRLDDFQRLISGIGKLLLHSTCKEVKSNKRSGASLPSFLVTSVTVKGEFLIWFNKTSPRSRSVMGSMPRFSSSFLGFFPAAIASFCFSASSTSSSSLFRRMAEKVVSR